MFCACVRARTFVRCHPASVIPTESCYCCWHGDGCSTTRHCCHGFQARQARGERSSAASLCSLPPFVCMCVCVCVCERERVREAIFLCPQHLTDLFVRLRRFSSLVYCMHQGAHICIYFARPRHTPPVCALYLFTSKWISKPHFARSLPGPLWATVMFT